MYKRVASDSIASSKLDVFSVPPTVVSETLTSQVGFRPITALTGENPLEFNVVSDSFLDVANSYLDITVSVKAEDGKPAHAATVITGEGSAAKAVGGRYPSCINNLFHSLFSQVIVKLNDVETAPQIGNYAYKVFTL
jgi:hypothetical protein